MVCSCEFDGEKLVRRFVLQRYFFSPPGMRKDCDLAVFIDVPKALAGKIKPRFAAVQLSTFTLYV